MFQKISKSRLIIGTCLVSSWSARLSPMRNPADILEGEQRKSENLAYPYDLALQTDRTTKV